MTEEKAIEDAKKEFSEKFPDFDINDDIIYEDPEDIIKGIKENSGNEESRPSVSLDLSSGIAWEDGGYKAQFENGSATIGGTVNGSDKLFVIDNGEVTEEVEIQEGAFQYTTEKAAGDTVHLAADDRLEVGQTDVDMDDLDRSEEIEFVE